MKLSRLAHIVFAFAAGDFTEFYEANEDNVLKEF